MLSLSRVPSAAVIASLAFAWMGASPAPPALATTPATPIEGVAVFEGQLNGHQVRAVVVHAKTHRLRITLGDGRKVTVTFPATEQQRLLDEIRAHGITVKVTKTQSPSHKRRDIAIGVAVVVIVVGLAVGAWLYLRKRRIREEEYGPGGAR